MFWIDLPAGFCLLFILFLLGNAFFRNTQRRWDKKEDDRMAQAYQLYVDLARYTPEQRATELKRRGVGARRLYYYACKRWDESGTIYDDMEEALQNGRKSRKLRRMVRLRHFWYSLFSTKVI